MVPAADAGAYMDKNDWNSLWAQVKWQRSYALSGFVPLIDAIALPASR